MKRRTPRSTRTDTLFPDTTLFRPPTTRQAVLVHHPDDAELLGHHPVMEAVVVVAHEAVPRGIALLDAPDLDSVVEENREWAHRLLESADLRSEEHTSELQSLMRISYAVFCLKKNTTRNILNH